MERKKKALVMATPFRCSRGHLIVVTRPKGTAQPCNCDRITCQDNNDEPKQCGPTQRITIEIY